MKNFKTTVLVTAFFLLLIISACSSEKVVIEPVSNPLLSTSAFTAQRVDSLTRVFTDLAPEPMQYDGPIALPRGGSASFQFVINSPVAQNLKLSLTKIKTDKDKTLKAETDIYEILPVVVEANARQAGTKVGEKTEEKFQPFLVREAPFEAAEVLVETDTIELKPIINTAVLCTVKVSRKAKPGLYKTGLIIKSANQTIMVPFALKVYSTKIPKEPVFLSSHWFSELPQELTGAAPPQPWSQGHWKLIEKIARQFNEIGDTSIHTELIEGADPMIQIIRTADGKYDFDFSRFDRWVNIFLKAGYETIDGGAIAGGHWISPPDIYAIDKATGKKIQIFKNGQGKEELSALEKKYPWPEYRDKFVVSDNYRQSVEKWGQFLAGFFDKLYIHLQKKGWLDKYRQNLLDEPRTVRDYAYISDLCRKHMPGVKIGDAIHGYGVEDYEKFSPYVDMWIMEMAKLAAPKSQQIIADRRKQGLKTGLYVLAGTTTWPNRLLDRPLTDNRTQPWIMFLYQSDYFIHHWAANRYRGVADPYKHSIGPTGPLPKGKPYTDAGHPPGCNWLFYPGPNGLRSSMRIVTFQAGTLDYTLLTMLAEKDKSTAEKILKTITRSATDYETNPAAYHKARIELLETLEKLKTETEPSVIIGDPATEWSRSKPDIIVYLPKGGDLNDGDNEHFLVFKAPKSSDLLAMWTQSTVETHGDNHIVLARSKDGVNWSEPLWIVGTHKNTSETQASWGFPVVSRQGRLYCFYTKSAQGVKGGGSGMMGGLYSDDDGRTWTEGADIQVPTGNFIVWQKTIRDSHGRWLAGFTCRSRCYFMRFDNIDEAPAIEDLKITWLPLDKDGLQLPRYVQPNFSNEPSIVLLPDGRLFTTMRTQTGHIWYSVSEDDGLHWRDPEVLRYKDNGRTIKHPLAPCPVYPLKDGRFLLIFHNNDLYARSQISGEKFPTGTPISGLFTHRRPAFIAVV